MLQEYVPKIFLQEKDEIIATLKYQLQELRDEITMLHRKHENDLDVNEANKREVEIQLLKEQLKETQEETSSLRNELRLKNYKLDDLQRLVDLHMIEDGQGSKTASDGKPTQRRVRHVGHGLDDVAGVDPKAHDDDEDEEVGNSTDEGEGGLIEDESLYTEATLPETQFWTQKQMKLKNKGKKPLFFEKPVLSRGDTLSSLSRRSGSSDSGNAGGAGGVDHLMWKGAKMTRQRSVELAFDDSSDSNHGFGGDEKENDKEEVCVVEDEGSDHDDGMGVGLVGYHGNQSTSQEYPPFTQYHQAQEKEQRHQIEFQNESQKSELLASEPSFENECNERIAEIQTSDAEDEFMNYENGTINRYTQHSHSTPSSPSPQYRSQGKKSQTISKSKLKSNIFQTSLATITTLDRQPPSTSPPTTSSSSSSRTKALSLSNHNHNQHNNRNNNFKFKLKIPRSINPKGQNKIINLTQNPLRNGPWWPEDFKINPLTNFGQDHELQNLRKLDSSLVHKITKLQSDFQIAYLKELATKKFRHVAQLTQTQTQPQQPNPNTNSPFRNPNFDHNPNPNSNSNNSSSNNPPTHPTPYETLTNPAIDPIFKHKINKLNYHIYANKLNLTTLSSTSSSSTSSTSKVKLWLQDTKLEDSPPGHERSEFPTTQQVEIDRLKSAKRSAVRALQFLVQAVLMVQKKVDDGKSGKKRKREDDGDEKENEEYGSKDGKDGDGEGEEEEMLYEQVGTHIFRSEELNCIVRSGYFFVDESIFADADHISIEGFR
ncbi:unnamed protein product [Ambrosiozyma monospora]|uniref:Unnamed protein product n=1 Tax=Ambrosiozyma monospora TaxID=43982 RepID=A0ACB5SUT0_AMBMO|nr:unnamed protein product [Ambrosiozyma monospora]